MFVIDDPYLFSGKCREKTFIVLANSWWKEASQNNGDIINFNYHHQSDNKTKTRWNIIKGNMFF